MVTEPIHMKILKKLSSIMFYRRLNFSIEDIGRILYKSSFPSYCSMIQEKNYRRKTTDGKAPAIPHPSDSFAETL